MKKQILILAFLVLAVFSNVNKSYGQCDDALHPVAGKTYAYTVTVNPTGGTFEWYVVTEADLLGGTHVVSDVNNYLVGGTGYNGAGTATASVNITWTGKAIADALKATNPTKFYVVVKYTAAAGCSDNLKAYSITPMNLFQITVENVDNTGAALTADICRADVVSATVNATGVSFDYGENAFYLKVTAKYFTTSWTPTINIGSLTGGLTTTTGNQSITSIEWARSIAALKGTSNFNLTSGVATEVVPDNGNDNITDGTDEVIYIKIVIDHGKFEGSTADQTLAFNLSAVDAAGNPDIDKDASCAVVTENDNVTQILKARPAITSATTPIVTGTNAFIPAN